jgi:hypothetical protein
MKFYLIFPFILLANILYVLLAMLRMVFLQITNVFECTEEYFFELSSRLEQTRRDSINITSEEIEDDIEEARRRN